MRRFLGYYRQFEELSPEEVSRELAALSVKLHATLVRAGLGPGLRR